MGQEISEENEEGIKDVYISGSSTCFPVIVKCAEKFEKDNDDYDIHVTGGGSSKGVVDVINGLVDLGMASRPLKSSEQGSDMHQLAFANDGIALIMAAGNSHFSGSLVPQWTMEDVVKIWNGTYGSWNDVPGCTGSEDIILIGRDSNSGTRASFEEITGLEDDPAYQAIPKQELNSNGAVRSSVAGDDDAIGYVGLGYIDDSVEGIDLWKDDAPDGPNYYEPTKENVKRGNYPISRKLYLIYCHNPEDDTQEFIDFILSSDGQEIVVDEGFIPL
jgi:phosphate transport system substrate-binding protein